MNFKILVGAVLVMLAFGTIVGCDDADKTDHWASNYKSTADQNPQDGVSASRKSAIPEPTSIIALGLGIAGFIARRRKKPK